MGYPSQAIQARFNTQPPEGGWPRQPKPQTQVFGFNTQPPEGGWLICEIRSGEDMGFNTQPPEGGWVPPLLEKGGRFVSTHSRLKAAGRTDTQRNHTDTVSTHSRLKAAGNVGGKIN